MLKSSFPLYIAVALCAGMLVLFMSRADGLAHNSDAATTAMAGKVPGGPFALTDQNGKTVHDTDFAGQYRLIYFGFTSCPDTCPLDLRRMADALKMAGPSIADKTATIFITVDPERDTPKVLKGYVAAFGPKLTGLTGTVAQIKTVEDEYKVYAAKVPEPGSDDYMMNHSAYIYLMGPKGEFLDLFDQDVKAPALAERLKKLMPGA